MQAIIPNLFVAKTGRVSLFIAKSCRARCVTVLKRHVTTTMMPIKSSPVEESSCPPVENAGIPRVARTSTFDAPVHIDVGGTIYTSSLETLTAFPESRLAMMFNGTIPIILDALKQHYFIDRDGEMFRHILNYLRYKKLLLPDDFHNLELLLHEAHFFGLKNMVIDLVKLKRRKEKAAGAGKHGLEVPVQAVQVKQEVDAPTEEDQNQPSISINALNSGQVMRHVTTTRGDVKGNFEPSTVSQENQQKLTASVRAWMNSQRAMRHVTTTRGEVKREIEPSSREKKQ